VGVDSRSGDLERELLLKLYRQLRIPVENFPPGVIVEYRDGFGIAMNYSDKPFEITLREQARIITGTRVINPGSLVVWKE
jgi:beta-galactosidase